MTLWTYMVKKNNNHHILFSRRQWEAEPLGKRLREDGSLIFNMDMGTHQELHAHVPQVPLLGHHALLGTFNRYNPTYNPTKDIDGLCIAIERSSRHPRAHRLERHLAGLAIEAIQLQKPYII